MTRFGIGNALVLQGVIAPEELSELVEQAQDADESLERHLMNTGRAEERQVLDAYARVYGLEVLDSIAENTVHPDTLDAFTIHYLKENRMIPLRMEDERTVLAMCNPASIALVQDVAFVLSAESVEPIFVSEKEITAAINRVFGGAHDSSQVADILEGTEDEYGPLDDETIEDLLDDTSDAPFIKLVNMILAQAVRAGASDVHIEPYKDKLRVRFRLDGVLYDKHTISRRFHAAFISRIKIMAKLNIAEKRLPQDGRIALSLGGRQVDLRVSCLPTSYGERVVLRLLEKSSRVLSMRELGLMGDDLKTMQNIGNISHGIVLVTGPTGSGKTTTLYALLSHINSPDKNILTIEDPVEYQLDGIGQMQVNSKIKLTFAEGLRSIVRQDPDVILIGEIRDKETADIAVQAALTGHLVFSTLHTNDAPSAVTRLIDMGVEPFLLSSVIRAVVAQRLVRVLCPHCKESFVADPDNLAEYSAYAKIFAGKTIHRPVGCPNCMNTGYKGRNAIYEIMQFTDRIKSLVLQTSDSNEIRKVALKEGMKSLRHDGCIKVLKGLTTLSEVVRVSNLQ